MGLCLIVNIKHHLSGASEALNCNVSLKLTFLVKHLFPDMSYFSLFNVSVNHNYSSNIVKKNLATLERNVNYR